MKRYAKYKDSGISWIGMIPEEWNTNFLFQVAIERKVSNKNVHHQNLLSLSYGRIVQKDINTTEGLLPASFDSYQVVENGNVVLRLTDLQNDHKSLRVGLATQEGIITSAYVALECFKKTLYPTFFYYQLHSFDVKKMFYGMGGGLRQSLTYDELKKIQLAVPPPEEQKAIAEFLDNKTKQINELVFAKQKQIELLKEYKQAVIAKAVTQGINPKAKMKDSGISWIGQIPEHWECSTLRKHLQFVSEKGHPEEQLLSVTREYGVIVRNTESKEENHNVIPEDLSNYKLVKKGQFAINKMKAWQGSYAVSSYTGIVSPAYYVCELNFEVKEFFSMAIRSKAYVPFFTMYSKGIRVDQWDLSPIGLKTIPLFIPPKDEQKRIVTFVNDKMVKIDSQISSIEKQIANLNEYKQSLISDVVTGKVKVA